MSAINTLESVGNSSLARFHMLKDHLYFRSLCQQAFRYLAALHRFAVDQKPLAARLSAMGIAHNNMQLLSPEFLVYFKQESRGLF